MLLRTWQNFEIAACCIACTDLGFDQTPSILVQLLCLSQYVLRLTTANVWVDPRTAHATISADAAFNGDPSPELLLQNRTSQAQAIFGPHSHHTCSRSASRSSYFPKPPHGCRRMRDIFSRPSRMSMHELGHHIDYKAHRAYPIPRTHAAYSLLLGRTGDCDTISSLIPSLRTAPHARKLPVKPIQWSRQPTA